MSNQKPLWPAFLLGIVVGSLFRVPLKPPSQKTAEAVHPEKKPTTENNPPTSGATRTPKSCEEHHYNAHRREYPPSRLKKFAEIAQVIIAIGALGTLIGNVFIIGAMRSQIEQMQRQNSLTWMQVIGTQQAIVNLVDFPGITQPDIIDIGVRNDGHVVADNINLTIKAKRASLPSKQPIGDAWNCSFAVSMRLAPTKTYEVQCRIAGFSDADWQAMADLKETVIIDGFLSYGNGFAEIHSQPICEIYVPKTRTKYGEEGEAKFMRCDEVEEVFSYLRKRKAEK